MFDLTGKVALLTGANGGIPRATAALFRRLGAHLVLTDLDLAALGEFAAALPPADQRILTRLGVAYSTPDSGCCGMAGPFGFEKDHYDVAQACGERVLLPAVRGKTSETLVVTEGFSCRTMITQNVENASPLTLPELVLRAMQT